jgi:vacuolar-type H+-ATPase subunit D/Vma8
MKAKLKGAETGHNLLKRKSEALTKSVSPCFEADDARADTMVSLQAIPR